MRRSVASMLSTHQQLGTPLSVGIVGGGLGGLACAAQLVRLADRGAHHIEVYDQCQPGMGGASAVAAGLCHPFTPRGTLIHKGLEGFDATLGLLTLVDEKCPDLADSVWERQAIVRPCFGSTDLRLWAAAAIAFPEWLAMESAEDYKERVGSQNTDVSLRGAAVMRSTLRINMPVYLKGLWRAVQSIGEEAAVTVKWTPKTVRDSADVDSISSNHDIVIVCSGVGVVNHWTSWDNQEGPPLKFVRGQNLIFDSDSGLRLSESLLCGEYIVPCGLGDGRKSYILAGATHEYESLDVLLARGEKPDLEVALSVLRVKLCRIHPALAARTPSDCNAGVRVVAKRTHEGKLPLIASSNDYRRWLLTGFGSRGVIHHALYAKTLIDAISKKFTGV